MARIRSLTLIGVLVGLLAATPAQARPNRHHRPHRHVSVGGLQIGPYRDDWSVNAGTVYRTRPTGSPAGPAATRNRSALVLGADPKQGVLRRLTQISLPLAVTTTPGEAGLELVKILPVTMAISVSGAIVWREDTGVELTTFPGSKTARWGGQLFSADFQNPLEVRAGQSVEILAFIRTEEGSNINGSIGWSVQAEKIEPGGALEWWPTGTGRLTYTDEHVGRAG